MSRLPPTEKSGVSSGLASLFFQPKISGFPSSLASLFPIVFLEESDFSSIGLNACSGSFSGNVVSSIFSQAKSCGREDSCDENRGVEKEACSIGLAGGGSSGICESCLGSRVVCFGVIFGAASERKPSNAVLLVLGRGGNGGSWAHRKLACKNSVPKNKNRKERNRENIRLFFYGIISSAVGTGEV